MSGKKRKRPSAQGQDATDRTAAPAKVDEGGAKSVEQSALGDMFGIKMGKEKGADAEESLPEDKVVLSVGEDRVRLLVQGVAFLLVVLVALFSVLVWWQLANMTGNVAFLLLVIAALTVAWFVSRAMGRRLTRFFMHTDVIDFGERFVFIYGDADPKKATVVPYGEIRSFKLIRQGRALRLLLSGKWVSHPSGFLFVDINRPFMAGTLEGLEGQIREVMQNKRVKQAKK